MPPITIALVTITEFSRDYLSHGLKKLGDDLTIDCYLACEEDIERIGRAMSYNLIVVEWNWAVSESRASSIGLLNSVRLAQPVARLAVISDQEDRDAILCAFSHGVHGFISTTSEFRTVIAALQLVLEGGTFAPAAPLLANLSERAEGSGEASEGHRRPLPCSEQRSKSCSTVNEVPADWDDIQRRAEQQLSLTRREAQILALLYRGRKNRQIASHLNISENTVMVHMRHLMRKLQATNRTQAVFHATRLLKNGA